MQSEILIKPLSFSSWKVTHSRSAVLANDN